MSALKWLIGCDSLSNLYLWHIKYSQRRSQYRILEVVIRFQICIFDILNTVHPSTSTNFLSCDSLSNLYLWHIKYSEGDFYNTFTAVVIRFQICIFDILNTVILPVEVTPTSCDSLSNLYLWHIKYSTRKLG